MIPACFDDPRNVHDIDCSNASYQFVMEEQKNKNIKGSGGVSGLSTCYGLHIVRIEVTQEFVDTHMNRNFRIGAMHAAAGVTPTVRRLPSGRLIGGYHSRMKGGGDPAVSRMSRISEKSTDVSTLLGASRSFSDRGGPESSKGAVVTGSAGSNSR